MLDQVWVPGFCQFVARSGGEFGLQGEQLAQRGVRRVAFAELAVDRGEREVRAPEARHIDFQRRVERSAVIAQTVGIKNVGEPIPSGMVRI